MNFTPSYLSLLKNGEFENRLKSAEYLLSECNCCPHKCLVNRTTGEIGICKSGIKPIVSSYTLHHGEEPIISGTNGAGNIFFGNCNLKCIYCQNYEISQNWKTEKNFESSPERVAEIMLELQSKNAQNIGLVSPTHFSISILKAIKIAAENGLYIPIIYNSNGYDSVEVLKLFDGVVDIYLPDIKYGCNENGKLYSNAENYFDHAKEATKEMFRQVGDKLIIENNILKRGMIIRHLILPNRLAETENVFRFISQDLSKNIFVSLMSQYYPANKAFQFLLLNRTINESEYYRAIELLDKYELQNGWIQEMESHNYYKPDFSEDRTKPFDIIADRRD